MRPDTSPFSREAATATQLNPGTINSALAALMQSELIEQFT
ncbi:MAG TPA: hypothetical protein VMU52_06315 [Steroidobacteraceae bacterium]|nr:hypothetical protein [Steroidobacteraceae bacterium]